MDSHVVDLDVVVEDLSGLDGTCSVAISTTGIHKVSARVLQSIRCTVLLFVLRHILHMLYRCSRALSLHGGCGPSLTTIVLGYTIQVLLLFLEDVGVLVRQAYANFIHLVDQAENFEPLLAFLDAARTQGEAPRAKLDSEHEWPGTLLAGFVNSILLLNHIFVKQCFASALRKLTHDVNWSKLLVALQVGQIE